MADGCALKMNNHPKITRIRVDYSKGEALRFTGHLDLQRLWERLLRRTRLPIRHSQGYHPRPRLNLASALPLGFISDAELLDFWMDESLSLAEIQTRLTNTAPPGLIIHSVVEVDLSEDSLQSQMVASEYEIHFFDDQEEQFLSKQIDVLMSADEIKRERRKKTYDLRPLILYMEVIHSKKGGIVLRMRLKAEPNATGRPDEVLDQLGFANTEYLVRRTKLILGER